jgi:hypothetical protein
MCAAKRPGIAFPEGVSARRRPRTGGSELQCCSCCLTFELTPTAEAGCARREVEHRQARFAAGTACRSGSGAERGVRPHR